MTALTHSILDNLSTLAGCAEKQLSSVSSPNEVDMIKVEYLGRRGKLNQTIRMMGTVPKDEQLIILAAADETGDSLRRIMKEARER